MALTWLRMSKHFYISQCGRFRIHYFRAHEWVLFDRSRKDAGQPQFDWSECCTSLGEAKQTAMHVARVYPTGKRIW